MTKDIAKRPQGAANNSCVDVDATIPCQGHARQQEADELRARVAELEASLSRADTRAMNAIADAEKRANWFASMALRGEELKFSPDDVVQLDKLIMGLMPKSPPLYDLIDTAVVVLCKAGKRLKALEARVVELEALCGEIYQVAGALGAPAVVLDALHAAASGDPLPGVSLIGLDIANEIERAEREKQEPVAYLTANKQMLVFADKCVDMKHLMTPLYADPPVTAPVRLTDEGIANIVWAGPANAHTFARAIEAASLRANGFDVQPAEAGD